MKYRFILWNFPQIVHFFLVFAFICLRFSESIFSRFDLAFLIYIFVTFWGNKDFLIRTMLERDIHPVAFFCILLLVKIRRKKRKKVSLHFILAF